MSDIAQEIDVRKLSVHYGTSQTLSEISCSFSSKEVTAIMGPSGCGKSTFIKALNRTLELTPGAKVTSGEVIHSGEDIYSKSADKEYIRKKIGIIHQRPVIFPMSIKENVLFGAKFHKLVSRENESDYAKEYLKKVGLWAEVSSRLDEPASKLSGGQQQRLCLARTIANKPSVILMDEPCSALDPMATKRIEELIGELKEEYTIVIVTHNMSQAKRVSKNLLFLFNGVLIESGSTEEIFSNPKQVLTREFVTGQIG